jgi:uncharacterized membrane protein
VKRDTRIVAPIFAAIPVVILGLSTLCTWLIARGASLEWRGLFRLVCHGLQSRCFELWNAPMPICTRCTAIYLGLLIGLVTFVVWPYFTERIMRSVALGAVIPLAVDGLTQLLRLRESTNELRFATGIVAGFAIGIWALSAIENRDETALKLS